MNLLGRLFNVTKGEIFVDDTPINKFKSKELRLAQAILYQDFVKYPTSVRRAPSGARSLAAFLLILRRRFGITSGSAM